MRCLVNLFLDRVRRQGLLQLLEYPEHSIAAHKRVVHHELEDGCVFQDDRAADQALDALAMPPQERESAFLLFRAAQNADENESGMQIAGDVHVVDRDQARVADLEFATNGFADLALEQFAHALESKRGPGWS